MWIVDVISRILHIGTAITLIGGSIFMLWVLIPSAKQLDDDSHQKLAGLISSRWKQFVHIGVTLFLISGFYNFVRALPQHRGDSLYHAILGTKILIAMVVFFIATALVGRSAKLESMRRNRETWLKVLVTLALVIVAMSGFVKVRGIPGL